MWKELERESCEGEMGEMWVKPFLGVTGQSWQNTGVDESTPNLPTGWPPSTRTGVLRFGGIGHPLSRFLSVSWFYRPLFGSLASGGSYPIQLWSRLMERHGRHRKLDPTRIWTRVERLQLWRGGIISARVPYPSSIEVPSRCMASVHLVTYLRTMMRGGLFADH